MNVKDLTFKDISKSGNSFIRQCLFKEEWEDNAEEYNKEVKKFIKASATTDDFVEMYLANPAWKKEQCYQVMLKQYKPDDVWYYIREMFGNKSRKTMADAGALKIGIDGLEILIPNGYGDGETRYAVLDSDEFYARSLMTYFTMINGKFNVYSYDCGDNVAEELDGKFQIYFRDGLIALVKLED